MMPKKCKTLKNYAGVVGRNKKGQPTKLLVPGSEGKQYQVIIRRFPGKLITTECRLQAGNLGHLDCKGNHFGSLCYHSQTAIEAALVEAGKVGAWCDSQAIAETLNHLKKGDIFKVKSHQGKGLKWLVVTDKQRLL